MKQILALAVLVASSLISLTGCGGGIKEDPILRLSGEEALTQGKQLMEQKKYARARRYLSHAFEVEPNSRGGREALLLVADTYYLQGGLTNFIQAESKYRDFLNRFPTSNQAGYAQYQIANSLIKRMEKPDRDQTSTQKALEAFLEVARLYPTSEYAEQARERIKLVQENLAEHEYVVGRFNYRFGNVAGAIARFEHVLETYPDYTARDKALYLLGLSQLTSRNPEIRVKSLTTFQRLRDDYPESKYLAKIPKLKAAEEALQALRKAELEKAADQEAEPPPEDRSADPNGEQEP